MRKILKKRSYESFLLTPVISSLHLFLHYFGGVPIVALVLRTLYKTPWIYLLRGIGGGLAIGLLVALFAYSIAYLVLLPEFNEIGEKVKGRKFRLLPKLSLGLLISLFFTLFTGYLLSRSPWGWVFMVLPLTGIILFLFLLFSPLKILLSSFKTLGEENPDLTKKLTLRTGDELEELAEYFNEFTERIKEIVHTIKEDSDTIRGISENLSSSSEETGASLGEVAKSVEELAEEAQRSSQRVEAIRYEAEKVASLVQNIDTQMKMALSSSSNANRLASEGQEGAERTVSMMEEIFEGTGEAARKMENLIRASQEIQGITSLISEISEQTDLLALNATIEAARVGEQGKGFAVVAEEIRRLAVETANSVEKVGKIVENITSALKEVGDAITRNAEMVERGREMVEETKKKLEEIAKSITLTTTMVKNVSKAAGEQTDSINKLFGSVEDMIKIYSSTAASIQEISASLEQQMASMEELQAMAQHLRELSEKMKKGTERFRIE